MQSGNRFKHVSTASPLLHVIRRQWAKLSLSLGVAIHSSHFNLLRGSDDEQENRMVLKRGPRLGRI